MSSMESKEEPDSGGHQNAAYEPDVVNIEPVIVEHEQTNENSKQGEPTQNGGLVNKGFDESSEYQAPSPAILYLDQDNTGYIGLDATDVALKNQYQSIKPTGKNGHMQKEGLKTNDLETGRDAMMVENGVYMGVESRSNQPYGFNRENSYKVGTETYPNEKVAVKESSRRTCCLISIVFILVVLFIVGVVVALVFVFVINAPSISTTQVPAPEITTVLSPVQMYTVTSSAIVTLDLQYSPELSNPNSTEYKDLEAEFTTLMDDAFMDADIEGTYEGVIINGFTSGSVIVDYDVIFTIIANDIPNAPMDDEDELLLFVEDVIEAQVTEVLITVSEDNSSSIPVMSFNVTGSEAEPVEVTTRRKTTTQRPTEPLIITTSPSTQAPPEPATTLATTVVATTTSTTSSMTTNIPSTAARSETTSTTSTLMTSIPMTTGATAACPELECFDFSACYSFNQTCDGVQNCADNSDEVICSRCPEHECFDYSGCYLFNQSCDGIPDCADGSDESFCSNCTEATCFNLVECYSYDEECDGVPNCSDGSDESFCSNCTVYTCADLSGCFGFNESCNGVTDCADGSDELFCSNCPELICSNGECYSYDQQCDNEPNCSDGSDELFCTTCPIGENICLNGNGCYTFKQFCDGVQDCEDGTDENFCPGGSCGIGEFPCDTGDECYVQSLRCDYVFDCTDGSDEQNCTSETEIDLSMYNGTWIWQSPLYPNKYPLNVDLSWIFIAPPGYRPNVKVTDLYTEPSLDVLRLYSGPGPAGEDGLALSGAITRNGPVTYRSTNESLFATFTTDNAVAVRGFEAIVTQVLASDTLTCGSNQYDCADGVVCMPSDKECSCPVKPADCNPPTDCFLCDGGRCIPFEQKCDGNSQCEFGEDERNCTKDECLEFLCPEGICISVSSVCDMTLDCSGGEDEGNCSYPIGEEEITLADDDFYKLMSPNYPDEYPNIVNYTWVFTANAGRKVQIHFDFFATHDANDYVIIGDGDVINENAFLRLYGGGFTPDVILSEGNALWVNMVTDRTIVTTGFIANVTSVAGTETLGECAPSDRRCSDHVCISAEVLCDVMPRCMHADFETGCPDRIDLGGVSVVYKTVTSPFLTIYSEGYPADYGDDVNATVHLTAQDPTHRILVAMRDFDVEEGYDFVTFYEGHDKSRMIASLSGLLPNQVIVSEGSEMTIEFLTDYVYGYRGFWFEVESQDANQGCGDDELACRNGQCRPAETRCDGIIDCVDFTDEDMCPLCTAVPSACINILPWNTTIFPNARFESEAEALQYYADKNGSLSCHQSAEFLLCATLYPECPHYGEVRTPCPSVCSGVTASCPQLSDLPNACTTEVQVDYNGGNPLCEAREGDAFNTSVCGTRPAYQGDGEMFARIVGGTFAAEGEFPWIGSLQLNGEQQCGATLLNEKWAITAAHCTGYYDEIVFGDLKLDVVSNHSVSRTITGRDITDHPDYFDTTDGDDITLIEFADPIPISEHVRPICLPGNDPGSETRAYRRCYAAGWGTLVFEGAASSNDLLKVLLKLLENEECSTSYDDIIPSKICAGYAEGGYDACQGDSGGPLMCEGDDGRWHLVGITSYGRGCGDPNNPGVYTRVSSYMGFIEDTINS